MSVEPRELIKQILLPIPSHRGNAIQSCNETVYNATMPTRDEIQRNNYDRRQKQLTQQGFHSPINEPYQAIGAPICLDANKLLLHSLGRSDEVFCNFYTVIFVTALLHLMSVWTDSNRIG